MTIMPETKPRISRMDLVGRLNNEHPRWTEYPITIVGIRGYYLDSMGKPGVNDRGVYDDAGFLVTPDVFLAANFNTDPSKGRVGMATLQPGFYPVYRFDLHHGKVSTYEAICQRSGPVTIVRQGQPGTQTGSFGINLHKGGFWTTGSEACQTVPPTQWDGFYALAKSEALRLWGADWRKKDVLYVLMEERS